MNVQSRSTGMLMTIMMMMMVVMMIILNTVDVLAVTPPAAYDISQKTSTESALSYALGIGSVIKSFLQSRAFLLAQQASFPGRSNPLPDVSFK